MTAGILNCSLLIKCTPLLLQWAIVVVAACAVAVWAEPSYHHGKASGFQNYNLGLSKKHYRHGRSADPEALAEPGYFPHHHHHVHHGYGATGFQNYNLGLSYHHGYHRRKRSPEPEPEPLAEAGYFPHHHAHHGYGATGFQNYNLGLSHGYRYKRSPVAGPEPEPSRYGRSRGKKSRRKGRRSKGKKGRRSKGKGRSKGKRTRYGRSVGLQLLGDDEDLYD